MALVNGITRDHGVKSNSWANDADVTSGMILVLIRSITIIVDLTEEG